MKYLILLVVLAATGTNALAIEEPKYRVIEKDGAIEIRDYEPYIVAETAVEGKEFDEASNEGFRRLAGYIFGGNQARRSIEMTAPVTTERSVRIAMTAPVEMQGSTGSYVITFMMPSEYTLETLPVPNDSRVTLRLVPGRKMAAIRFSGFWTEESFRERTEELLGWLKKRGIAAAGDPVLARYNSPWSLWFLRRNEVLVPIQSPF